MIDKTGTSAEFGRWWLGTLICVVLLAPWAARAQTPYVPPPLEAWVPWALDGQEHLRCPSLPSGAWGDPRAHLCAWPGALSLDVSQTAARFSVVWTVEEESDIPLPGGARLWPLDLKSDGRAVPVTRGQTGHRPVVRLAPGRWKLEGVLAWPDERPLRLPVPAVYALIDLRVDGAALTAPRHVEEFLEVTPRAAPAEPEPTIRLRVFRRYDDQLPALLVTRLELEVGGAARELLLGPVVADGFTAYALSGDLGARLEPDGRLRIQARPGSWALNLRSWAPIWPERLGPRAGAEAWWGEEIWAIAAKPAFRSITIDGGKPVDPLQVGAPAFMDGLPAWRLGSGESLALTASGRGLAEDVANRLTVRRSLWRDFSGSGWTALDRLSGRFQRGWRLEAAAPWRIEAASAMPGPGPRGRPWNPGEPLMVTRGPEGGTGLEVRAPEFRLHALSRLEDPGSRVPASGWQSRTDGLAVRVNLPPGQRLLAAQGPDRTSGAWIGRWTLTDMFLLLLVAVSAGRLLGALWGLLAIVMLALVWQEPGAPRALWLLPLAGLAVARYLPAGRPRRFGIWARNIALVLLLLATLPFVGQQLRYVLFPQLDTGGPGPGPAQLEAPEDPAMSRMAVPAAPGADARTGQAEAATGFEAQPGDSTMTVSGNAISLGDVLSPWPENARPQTGPGLPGWGYRAYDLLWNGDVAPEETVRLHILDTDAYRIWRLLAVLLIFLVIWRLGREALTEMRRPDPAGSTAAAVSLVLLLTLGLPPRPAMAELPAPALLQELRERLVRPPSCWPDCVSVTRVSLRFTEDRLELGAEVHAELPSAVVLPGADGWDIERITVNGTPASGAGREGPALAVPVEAGIQRVGMLGRLGPVDGLSLRLPLPAERVDARGTGWDWAIVASGEESVLQLARDRASAGDKPRPDTPTALPNLWRVERQLRLDENWEVVTSVRREGSVAEGATLTVPLLDGESPRSWTDALVSPVDGAMQIRLGSGDRSAGWISTYAMRPSLNLRMGKRHWTEHWEIAPSPIWQTRFSGTPQLGGDASREAGTWIARFAPLPGETLAVDVNQPEAAAGPVLAFDEVRLATVAGKRRTVTTLELRYRATVAGQHALGLPDNARLESLSIDGEEQNIEPGEDGRLVLPVSPDSHQVRLSISEPADGRQSVTTPPVELDAVAANVHLSLGTAPDEARWPLLARGPGAGPAVLYWSELAVFGLLALALGRVRRLGVKTWEWLLLGLGFSTFNWGILLLVTAWLVARGWLEHAPPPATARAHQGLLALFAAFTALTLLAVVWAIPTALLGSPDMHVVSPAGPGFSWFVDRVDGPLPTASVHALPLWAYQVAILLWSLWLVFALIRWLTASWRTLARGGPWRWGRDNDKPEPSSAS